MDMTQAVTTTVPDMVDTMTREVGMATHHMDTVSQPSSSKVFYHLDWMSQSHPRSQRTSILPPPMLR